MVISLLKPYLSATTGGHTRRPKADGSPAARHLAICNSESADHAIWFATAPPTPPPSAMGKHCACRAYSAGPTVQALHTEGLRYGLERKVPSMQPLFVLRRRAKRLARDLGVTHTEALDRIASQHGFRAWSLLVAQHDPASASERASHAMVAALPGAAPSQPAIAPESGLSVGAAGATALRAAEQLWTRMQPGDMALLGARPGQGKTLASLAFAAQAMRAGSDVTFFSLEETDASIRARLGVLSGQPEPAGRSGFAGNKGAPDKETSGIAGSDLIDTCASAPQFRTDCSDDIDALRIASRAAGAGVVIVDYLQLLDQKRDLPGLQAQVEVLATLARAGRRRLVVLSQIDRTYDPARKPCPDFDDVRLPNPLDLTLFDRACFLQGEHVRVM